MRLFLSLILLTAVQAQGALCGQYTFFGRVPTDTRKPLELETKDLEGRPVNLLLRAPGLMGIRAYSLRGRWVEAKVDVKVSEKKRRAEGVLLDMLPAVEPILHAQAKLVHARKIRARSDCR